MPRYAAFLRGVMPMNAKMPELKRAFEKAGFDEVRTVLGSGNVVLQRPRGVGRGAAAEGRGGDAGAPGADVLHHHPLDRRAAGAPRPRPLRAVPAPSGVEAHRHLPPPCARPAPARLPDQDGARILHVTGREVFTAYLPTPKGPVFMALIEKTFGTDLTTRTWDTVKKVAR